MSSDECQVQWMNINPVLEDDNENEYENENDDIYHPTHENSNNPSWVVEIPPTSPTESVPAPVQIRNNDVANDEIRLPLPVIEPTQTQSATDDDGCPRLDLSLSDHELDALLNSLPTSGNNGPYDPFMSDHKLHEEGESSEMQWVLSFLTNPDQVAQHDVEAKQMLQNPTILADDDNYQYFLQQLNHANLLSTPPLVTSSPVRVDKPRVHDEQEHETDRDEDSSDESDEEWDADWQNTREQIKSGAPVSSKDNSQTTSVSHGLYRRSAPKHTQMPPSSIMGEEEDENEPENRSNTVGHKYHATVIKDELQEAKRIALSYEIGKQLQTQGSFKFPAHLFPSEVTPQHETS